MATMAEMHSVFVETNLETRLALLLHKDDHVSAFKDKFCKEHVQCFPSFGEITVSALKVNWQDQYYHLSDSMILSKVFEGNNSEGFVFVDVASVEEKGDPTHEETLQIQAPEEITKKRQLKSSVSGKKSRKKLAVDPNQSALVDELSGKEIESGEGNVIGMGENQKSCDDGLVDGHAKDVQANEAFEEAVESGLAMKRESHISLTKVTERKLDLDLNKAMKQGEKMAAATTDVVMIDQEEDLENDNLLPTSEVDKTTDAEYEGFIDGVDVTSESIPNAGGENVTNTLVEAKQNGNEKVDIGEKDGDEAKPVKPKKKTKSRMDKTVPKEDTQVDSTTPNAVLALSATNVEAGNVNKDSQENVKKVVKKSSKSSKKKQPENIVEDAQVVSVYAAE